MAGQEQAGPEAVRHPGAHRPGDQQPDHHVAQYRGPLHDEDMADRGVALPAEQAPPEAAGGGDAHVHGRVPFHGPGQAPVRLPPRLVDQLPPDEQAEGHRD